MGCYPRFPLRRQVDGRGHRDGGVASARRHRVGGRCRDGVERARRGSRAAEHGAEGQRCAAVVGDCHALSRRIRAPAGRRGERELLGLIETTGCCSRSRHLIVGVCQLVGSGSQKTAPVPGRP